ncbi:MAG: type II toxin-antitoxin system HicB family antitoxin [Candidatus Aenigmarchaeota archaeon]|nr:type II toxin-antitoxin system HicB family antitoxin [Candidatus Aenigmarchaeota archaeon]
MKKKFFVVIEKGKNNYIGSVVGLYGCRSTAKTANKLMNGIKNTIKNYLRTDEFYPYKIDFVGVRILKTARYKSLSFTTVIEKDRKYYTANVPSLAGCFTQANTIQKLMKNVQEVISICFGLKKDFEKTGFAGIEMIEVDL